MITPGISSCGIMKYFLTIILREHNYTYQNYTEVAEKHISNNCLDLIEKIEARCGQSKITINQNIDLACNLWEVALDYGKHFVFQLLILQTTSPNREDANSFEIMFNTQNSITLPTWKASAKPNKKDQLRSDIVAWIKKENCGWIGLNMAETVGKPFIQDLTNVLWYIDGCNSDTFTQRYNLPKLNEHSECLLKYATYPWMTRPPFSTFLKKPIIKLGEDLSKYAEYLVYKPSLEVGFEFKVRIYTYHHENVCNTTYIWHIDEKAKVSNQHYKIRIEIKKCFPTYYTRRMHKEYMDMCDLHLNKQPKAKLRRIYKELTNDASAAKTTSQKEVDERVKLAFELNDPEIISDLRELNEDRLRKYDEFWAAGKKFLEGTAQEAVVAVDERRYDPIVHLAQAISVCDLCDMITKEVKKINLQAPIPSTQWLRLQFWPTTLTNKNKMAIMFRDDAHLVFMDDKHRCKVGEPGHSVAAVDRGKRVLVNHNTTFVVSDHDFTKYGIIPSVTMLCNIPKTIEESFYTGKFTLG
ncbi:hypothetical protein C2G38_2156325 [Gigaspora rosea]|uniref:Uncharacterized protein n=1 Tax=Gigaspora rosea TaxID=44941 RepID=A0A397W4W9_9GLOM|nr:hypothetical protein C2G38_2156325 [Gigaspora rosea]